jgi:hypothetical protein
MQIKRVVRFLDSLIGSPLVRLFSKISRLRTIKIVNRYKKSSEINFQVVFSAPQNDELTKLLVHYGSDKASLFDAKIENSGHKYSYFYRSLFSAYRDKYFNFLEFGIDKGASLRAWSDYFPKADIFGVDYKREFLFNTGRISTFEVDMYSPLSLKNFVSLMNERKFEIVIDDGPHDFLSTKTAWESCLPTFADQFIYVCEDIPMRELESYSKFFEQEASRLGLNFYFVFFNQKNWPKELHGSNDYNTLGVLTRF